MRLLKIKLYIFDGGYFIINALFSIIKKEGIKFVLSQINILSTRKDMRLFARRAEEGSLF